MARSIRVSTKRRGRPKTTGKGEMIGVRLHPPLLTQLENWAAKAGVSAPEAIRRLVSQSLGLKD
jgi:hypothetical protein